VLVISREFIAVRISATLAGMAVNRRFLGVAFPLVI
jgi:hypothetical protein